MRKIQFPHHNRGTVPLKRTQSWLLMSVGTSRGRARNLCALPHSSHPWRTQRLSAQQVLVLLLSVRIAVKRSKVMKINVFFTTNGFKEAWLVIFRLWERGRSSKAGGALTRGCQSNNIKSNGRQRHPSHQRPQVKAQRCCCNDSSASGGGTVQREWCGPEWLEQSAGYAM